MQAVRRLWTKDADEKALTGCDPGVKECSKSVCDRQMQGLLTKEKRTLKDMN